MASGGSRRRECLKPAKKQALRRPERCAAQVPACLSTVEPPPRRERRHAFPGSQVFGTGTLPVGFQGRSALVAEGEIPIQETCTRRDLIFVLSRRSIQSIARGHKAKSKPEEQSRIYV